jgi:hypothetical protein
MRWSSLNSLLLVLLASVAFDGILARPVPDTDALYPRAPTPPPPPPKPSRSKTLPPPASPPQTRSKTKAAQQPPPPARPQTPPPHPYNLRPPSRAQTLPPQNPVAKGKQPAHPAPPPSKIPQPAGHSGPIKAGDLKSYNYREKAVDHGAVYSPGQGKVVHRQPTTSELKTLHADHVYEAQTAKHVIEQQGLNTPQRQAVKKVLNDPADNLVLTMDRLNINKGHETTKTIKGGTSNPTPNTKRYMDTVSKQGEDVGKKLDKVAGTGDAFQKAHEQNAKGSGTGGKK